jgi:flagellar hook assembly protein FlgD/outer membrane protein OmpA-like peptidoglycan-associated protein
VKKLDMGKVVVRVFVLLTFLAPALVQAQGYNPPDGTDLYFDLFSPVLLSTGDNSDSFESPMAEGLNPAAAALKQRVAVDLSYMGLSGFQSQPGYGNVVNAGVTIPTAAGVFAGSGHVIALPFSSLDTGTVVDLRLSFAKDLFADFLIGTGLSLQLGSNDTFAWGAGLDLGFIKLQGDVGALKDFRWGLAIRGLGKGYNPVTGRAAFPPPFTPAIASSFSLIQNDAVDLALHGDLSFPIFQALRLNLGVELAVRDFFFLRASYSLDSVEISQGRFRLPSFGLGFKFKTNIKESVNFLGISERGWNRSEISWNLSAAPLANGIWAFATGVNIPLGVRDNSPPAIDLGETESYISPNLDGTKDDLVLPLSLSDERYVMGYRFIIGDEAGSTVRDIRNKDERPENEGIRNFIDRLLYVKRGITVPETLRWDGRDEAGAYVADGKYSYFVEAWDDNGNVQKSNEVPFSIDSTAPDVNVQEPSGEELILSPNDDGNKDVLAIQQSGSSEGVWKGSIEDVTGTVVARWEWRESAPSDFIWDGKDMEGILVPDGVYTYRVSATDEAGNSTDGSLGNIVVNTETTPVSIGVDKSYFSPNADGSKDTIMLRLDVPVKRGIKSWRVDIVDSGSVMKRDFSGNEDLPNDLIFDGKDKQGAVLAEGTYTALLKLLYENGNNPAETSPGFTIDLTPPKAQVRADTKVFSPNGDGNKDFISFFQETSEELLWHAAIEDASGNVVKDLSWPGKADAKFVWDGSDDRGTLLPDGSYTYRLFTDDKAGNRGLSDEITFGLDTEETPVILFVGESYFSPNSDGIKDKMRMVPQLKVTSGIDSYELAIFSDSGEKIRLYSARDAMPEFLLWDGLDEEGKKAADGQYYAELQIEYEKGNVPVARSNPFHADTSFPSIEAGASPMLFSPDGDGRIDTVTISQQSSEEELWTGGIYNWRGEAVRNFFWKGAVQGFVWDGRDDEGNTVADGAYSYTVDSTDRAGNATTVDVLDIIVDTKPTPIFVTASTDGFSPNDDGFRDTIFFNIFANVREGIRSWQLDLVDQDARVQKTYVGEQDLPHRISWNGRSDSGSIIEGTYQGTLTLDYEKGNRPVERSIPFKLDISPPDIAMAVKPAPFSPDNDGIEDELYINLEVKDLSSINEWRLTILDPKKNVFSRYDGQGTPAGQIIWDGRSDRGELVQSAEDYELIVSAVDELDNSAEIHQIVPIDVLVIREGDRLKIRISNITFEPNTPDIVTADTESAERNVKTLRRLAEILDKFETYQILIEGHAVNLSWEDPEKAKIEEEQELQPLSLARAEAVKEELGKLGVNIERITTAGRGGTQPVVPFSDAENRWKNRRVEFILIKE